MPAKPKKAEAVRTFTLAEAAKILAEQRKAAKAATAERRKTVGIHAVPLSEGDATHGVLAKCECVTGTGVILHGSAYRRKDGTTGFTVDANPWRYGVTGTPAEVVAKVAAMAKNAAEIVGWLQANA